MAITTINLTDPVSTLVTKTNTISNNLGDVTQLVTGDSNAVDAINNIFDQIYRFNDSAEIAALARGSLSINNDSASGLSLSYDSDTGVIALIGGADAATVRSYLVAGTGLEYDSATGVFSISIDGVTATQIAAGSVGNSELATDAVTQAKIANDAVGSSELKDVVQLIIYNSAGTPVKTLYGAGS